MSATDGLRIVVYEEDGIYVAQCLEHDICTQANDRTILRERMDHLIQIELDGGQSLDPAPERFHKMWPESNHTYHEVAA